MIRQIIWHTGVSHGTFRLIQAGDNLGAGPSRKGERHFTLFRNKGLTKPKLLYRKTSLVQPTQYLFFTFTLGVVDEKAGGERVEHVQVKRYVGRIAWKCSS